MGYPHLQFSLVATDSFGSKTRGTSEPITVEDTRRYEQSTNAIPGPPKETAPGTSSDEPRTLTFAELKDLIEKGKTDQIPNNRHIPEAINVSRVFEGLALRSHRIFFMLILGGSTK